MSIANTNSTVLVWTIAGAATGVLIAALAAAVKPKKTPATSPIAPSTVVRGLRVVKEDNTTTKTAALSTAQIILIATGVTATAASLIVLGVLSAKKKQRLLQPQIAK